MTLPMKPASARALTWLAAIIIVIGFLVGSPSGACVAFFAAAIVAVVPALFGSGKIRLVAVGLLLVGIALAARSYPAFQREQETYRSHSKSSPAERKQ